MIVRVMKSRAVNPRQKKCAGACTDMQLRCIERALVMSHPRTGILAVERELCHRLRLATLCNLACCMCCVGKPHLGLRHAVAALRFLNSCPQCVDHMEVRCTRFDLLNATCADHTFSDYLLLTSNQSVCCAVGAKSYQAKL